MPPKKPPGPYMRYCKDLINKNSFPGKSMIERAIILGKQWKELNAAQKQPYEDAFQKDQVRE